MVEHFDQVGSKVRPEDLHGGVLISSDPARHVQWLHEAAELGFDEINLHHVGQDQAPFIHAFGEHVLPELA
jgi:alkanesulfonate monooxygenase SsuD/methylene tetrahydromethanopterin reductase-like flavin-dependent oxidoreductase (luciferase family)